MKSLSKQTLIIVNISTLILLVALDIFIWTQTKSYFIDQIKQESHYKVTLAKKILVDSVYLSKDRIQLKTFADEIRNLIGLRTTLIDKDGTVLSDSEIPINELDNIKNHLERPEVQEALRTGAGLAKRHSDTIDRELIYYCENLRENGRVIGFIRFATFSEDLDSKINYLRFVLIISNIIIFLIVSLIAHFYWKFIIKQFRVFEKNLVDADSHSTLTQLPPQHFLEFDSIASVINHTIIKVNTRYSNLEYYKNHLSNIFGSLNTGVASFDSEGRLNFYNNAFLEILNLKLDIAKEIKFYDLIDFPPIINDIRSFEEKRNLIEKRIKYYENKYIEYQIFENKFEEGSEASIIIAVEDVTNLQELETVRTDFVANVSHEFKTPLTSIRGYAETLLSVENMKPELSQKFLTKIQDQTQHLENLVMDLLSLTRIENEQQMDIEKIDINNSVLEILEDFKPQVEAKKQKIIFENKVGKEKVFVEANQFLIQNILSNLITNAMQYNKPRGQIELKISIVNKKFRVEVSDEGMGISKSEQKRIFERFYRVEETKSIYAEGSGLGLSIVKHAVDLLNGEMGVESEIEKGSKFWFELPIL